MYSEAPPRAFTDDARARVRAELLRPELRAEFEKHIVRAKTQRFRTNESLQTSVLARMEQLQLGDVLSVQYARCVPADLAASFFAMTEVAFVRGALEALLLVRSDAVRARRHMTEEQLHTIMMSAGGTFLRANDYTLRGPMRAFVPNDSRDWYDGLLDSPHCHPAADGTTPLRVLTYQMETTLLVTLPNEQQRLARHEWDRGYYVIVVLHRVSDDLRCFRTFSFSRRALAFPNQSAS